MNKLQRFIVFVGESKVPFPQNLSELSAAVDAFEKEERDVQRMKDEFFAKKMEAL
jgi:hypothetical protein